MGEAIVGRWGKNLAVRLPGDVAKKAGIRVGERVEVSAEEGAIVVRRAVPRYSIEKLFRGKSPAEWRLLYAGAFEWGPDLGREAVEE